MAAEIIRKNKTASDLRRETALSWDPNAVCRVLAIALVLDGIDRKTAVACFGMDRQTPRYWVHRYNTEGAPGLLNHRPPGPPRLLSTEQKKQLAEIVRADPSPETAPRPMELCGGDALN